MWFWLHFQVKWNNWRGWRNNLCSFLQFLSLWYDYLFYYVVIVQYLGIQIHLKLCLVIYVTYQEVNLLCLDCIKTSGLADYSVCISVSTLFPQNNFWIQWSNDTVKWRFQRLLQPYEYGGGCLGVFCFVFVFKLAAE